MKHVKFNDPLCYIPAISSIALDDCAMRPVGLMFELLDTRDIDDKADADCPYIVSASIMLDTVNPAFGENEGGGTPSSIRENAYHYCGGVPVDHLLQDGVKDLFTRFTIDEAKKVTTVHDYGTIAAQRGRGASYTSLQFATVEAAEKYAKFLLSQSPALAVTIGFVLDKPINMGGRDGWSVLRAQFNGPDVYGKED